MTPSIAPLRNVAALISLVERVQDRSMGLPGMAVFYGPSGWGKTTATSCSAKSNKLFLYLYICKNVFYCVLAFFLPRSLTPH